MKIKIEWWHILIAVVAAVFSAVIGAVVQILLMKYGVFDLLSGHPATNVSTGFTESHGFTWLNDTACVAPSHSVQNLLTEKCVANGYVTYSYAECSVFAGRSGPDLFLRCVR